MATIWNLVLSKWLSHHSEFCFMQSHFFLIFNLSNIIYKLQKKNYKLLLLANHLRMMQQAEANQISGNAVQFPKTLIV
jgi:hypothetical protein